MIASLMLDCGDSADFPGNNGMALGRPLAAYPLIAAKASRHIRRHFVVSDSPPVKAVAGQYGAIIIDPPPAAGGGATRAEALLRHGVRMIREDLKGEATSLELLVVLLANAPAVTSEILDLGIEALQNKPDLDSAVSVSVHNRMNPLAARRLTGEGILEPFVDTPAAGGDAWYPDGGVQVLRPRGLEAPTGAPPAPWQGMKVLALKQWGAGPIDHQWQIPSLEFWLRKHGVSDISPNLERQPLPKLAPAPKGRP